MIQGIAGIVQVAVPRPDEEPDMPCGPGVIARHLVAAKGQGIFLPAVHRRGMLHALGERLVERRWLRDEPFGGRSISGRIAPAQSDAVGLGGPDHAPLHRLGGPGESDPRAHGVHPQVVHLGDEPQERLGRVDPEHGAQGIDRLIVIADHGRLEEIRRLLIGLTHGSDVDACHGAMGACQAAPEIVIGQGLARELTRSFEPGGLEVPRWQRPDLVQGQDVGGRAQLIILFHDGRGYGGVIDLVIDASVGAGVRHRQGAMPRHHDALDPLAAEHGAQPQPPKVAVGLDGHVGVGHEGLARRADTHDGAHPRSGLVLADDAARGHAGEPPDRPRIAKADASFVDGEIDRDVAGTRDDDRSIASRADGHRATPAGVALSQVARQGGFEHGHRFAGQGEHAGQRANGKDDRIGGIVGIDSGGAVLLQEVNGRASPAQVGIKQLGAPLHARGFSAQIDVEDVL